MAEKINRKALIVYASIFGNTESVALRFKHIIEKKDHPWGDWKCETFKITKSTDRKNIPVHLEDHDLFLVGSPIWGGIPPLFVFDDHLGALGPIIMPRIELGGQSVQHRVENKAQEGGLGAITEPYGMKKGVVFVTYGGDRQGTHEAWPALDCLQLRIEDARIKCIGKFACPGGNKWARTPVDTVARVKGWGVGEAASAISLYRSDPNHPHFASLSQEDRQMFEKAAEQTRELPPEPEVPGARGLHWDIYNRPNDRDLLKAEIFMEEILEDYFGGGIEAAPFGQNICVS